MNVLRALVVAAVAATLASCGQQGGDTASSTDSSTATATTAAETSTETATTATACAAVAHRNWSARLAGQAGGASTLTISGQVDLPTPGYAVSLVRDAAESPAATEPHLTLSLTPPAGVVAQVVTPTPAYYFAPAGAQYTRVHIMCGGAELTAIDVTH
ncbi:hypothetical protein [Terricaulis sp.]|uniref:hypothetical protein n=1 Tax=Terricaulis sp. TaxID=2768686 RepID=UPI00378517B2